MTDTQYHKRHKMTDTVVVDDPSGINSYNTSLHHFTALPRFNCLFGNYWF